MIKENINRIFKEIPEHVCLLAASKARSIDEIKEAFSAGIRIVGENYVQEARDKRQVLGEGLEWHLIGHLQRSKVKEAVRIFDFIQTLDSYKLAFAINKECEKIGKVMPVLIEVNSGDEPQKSGLSFEQLQSFLKQIRELKSLKPQGLMTMGPWLSDPEKLRPYFSRMRESFLHIKRTRSFGLQWRYLSMGMSNSYRVAVEEGANMVRIGAAIFGEREHKI